MPDADNDRVKEPIARFNSVWTVLAEDRKNADLSDRPGILTCWADNHFPVWNVLLLDERVSEPAPLKARLGSAAAYMRSKEHAGMTFVCEERMSGAAKAALGEAAASECLRPGMTLTAMVGDILPLHAPGHPSLRFERVGDETALQVYADLNNVAYNLPPGAVRAGLLGSQLWIDGAFSFVAFDRNGEPVSAASVLPHDGSLYLALVATLPDARKQGFSEAPVRHALQEAHLATGLRRTDLHATDIGASVYRPIGYQPTTKFYSFVLDQ